MQFLRYNEVMQQTIFLAIIFVVVSAVLLGTVPALDTGQYSGHTLAVIKYN